MSAYATWQVYKDYYGTVKTEEEFNKLNYRVSLLLDTFTGQRAASVTGVKAARLNDAACRLIDLVKLQESSAAGTGVTSVSNDGYSESYAAATPEAVMEMYRQTAFAALSGTGLMGAL